MKRRFKAPTSALPHYVFQVERLSHEGRGIAHYGTDPSHPTEKHGKKVFISNALPGEIVRAQLTHQSAKFEQAQQIASQLETGTVWINSHADVSPAAPFGGWKLSGLGYSFGLSGLLLFTKKQAIHVTAE